MLESLKEDNMKNRNTYWVRGVAGIALGLASILSAAEPVVLTFDQPETAGISGFRKWWDVPQSGSAHALSTNGLVFDAVHRSLLVRFPGVAERIAGELGKGFVVRKVELVLPFANTDIGTFNGQSDAYADRQSFGGTENYAKNKPNWHAVAWLLRKPWSADTNTGPTFNAYIKGSGYWAKYGAQDTEHDRFSAEFGPTEISLKQPEGRMDVTATLTNAAFGKTLARRLRTLEDCGFLLRKWEVYDFRFRKPGDGAYEWQVGTGGFGLYVKAPRLVVTLEPGKGPQVGPLPPAAAIPALAAELKTTGKGGRPTAFLPTADDLKTLLAKHAPKKPAGMADWQWTRIEELLALGGGNTIPATPEAYAKWIDGMLATPPRYWSGFNGPDQLLPYFRFRDAIPAYVQDHYFRDNWTAWLEPDRPTSFFDHPQAMELWHGGTNTYYLETGDWRGNASPYRDGYCYVISTMNFNHWSVLGALLGGSIIQSKFAMEDGRHGFEYMPLRLWSWFDGTTQESIDHYYFPITVDAQKMVSDFGPEPLDRLMGQSCVAKSIEELTSSYHPGLRHFIYPSTRTSIPEYLLQTQGGLQMILHTLSRTGTLHDIGNTNLPGRMPVFGEGSGEMIAQSALVSPWAPSWVANMVDEKPIPFEMVNTFKQWGARTDSPLWKRSYLGRHYGLASSDLRAGILQAMAQWRRADRQVATILELGTMDVRYGINTTQLANNVPAYIEEQGCQAILQHKNAMVVVASPFKMAGREGVKSLQSTLAFYNFEAPAPTWEIYVDGVKVDSLPFKARQGQRITIKDGVTFIGIIPLPATDLGRSAEVVLQTGTPQPQYPDYTNQATLVVNSYNRLQESALDKGADWDPVDKAYGGYAVEYGDITEYKDFAAFQKHMTDARLEVRWETEKATVHVTYTTGTNVLEMGCRTDYAGGDKQSTECFAYRRVNGQWPYLPEGLERDSTLSQIGRSGRLEKNGAVLTCEPGSIAYLQTEPISGTICAWNPLPDPTCWMLETAGGMTVKADGRLGLARVTVQPGENKIWVDYGVRDDQRTPDMATALLVFGVKRAPVLEWNGKPYVKRLATVEIEGQKVYVIPLLEGVVPPQGKALIDRYERARKLSAFLTARSDAALFVQDWYVAGPFYNDFLGRGFDTIYAPEQNPGKADLKAVFSSKMQQDGKELTLSVGWKRILPEKGAPVGSTAVNLLPLMTPNKGTTAYAWTSIVSDRERAVVLYTGSDESIAVWLNGEPVLRKKIYRAALKDQDKIPVKLKKGENTVLVKLSHGYEAWHLFFRLGDEYGFPITEGITFGFGT
jgi:hypothetical protein